MKKLLLLVAMIVLIPACTHYYVKPGQTSASFDRDKRECQKIAEKEAAKARGFATSARNACSPKGGAGIAAISACQSIIVLGLPCSQANAA